MRNEALECVEQSSQRAEQGMRVAPSADDVHARRRELTRAQDVAAAPTETAARKLTLNEKISYSFTDLAGNVLYVTISTYIMYFYTDVAGIGVAAAGLILLIARVIDALSAVAWGSVIDHTHTKWGQSRPYFLWLAVPFGLATVVAFMSPDTSENGKFWYAIITYVLAAGIIYTGIQTPITAILPNLTTDRAERVNANSFRMIGGAIGTFITGTFCLPLVLLLGGGDDARGFVLTVGVFAVLAIVLLLYAFANLRERTDIVRKPIPLRSSLRAARGNTPWVLLVVAFAIFWIAQADRNSMSVYYAKYLLGNEQLASVFNGLQVVGIVGAIAIPFIVRISNKTGTMVIGLAIAAVGQALMAFVGDSLALAVIAWTIGVIGTSIAIAMPFAMLADTVEFGEWRTGIRASGFLTAVGSAFCIQLGSGLGSFIPSRIMDAGGFEPNAPTQSPSAIASISFSFIWLPIIVYAVVAAIMYFYYRYEKMEPRIKRELAERHAGESEMAER